MNRTYDLPSGTVERIDEKARELGVYQSDLVSHLLTHGLDAIEAGALVLFTRPRGYVIDKEPAPA